MKDSKFIPRKKIAKSDLRKESEVKNKASELIRREQLINLGLTMALLFVVIFGIFAIYLGSNSNNNFLSKFLNRENKDIKEAQLKPAAVVNNEPITVEELEERLNLIPQEYKQLISMEEILSQLIDEKLLLQEASKLDIVATEKDIDAQIELILAQGQLSMEQLESSLKSRNLTIENMREFTGKEIMLNKLLESQVLSKVMVSDTDIKDYYFTNPDQFIISESLNVSHILVCHNESMSCFSNISKAESLEKIEELRKEVNATNFAELAALNSDEPSAKITFGNLGWVSKEDPYDETFLNETFKLNIGEVSKPVETVFGYHLIFVNGKRDKGVLELSVVYDQINNTLSYDKNRVAFFSYVEGLRNNSQIITFLGNN